MRAMIRLIAEPVGGVCVAVDMTREGRPRADRVQSVDRAVELLRAVAAASGSDSGAAALAQMCGLNRATAWRLLMTLEEQGMVARNPRTGWFTLGPTFLELRTPVGRDGLVEAARPVLERLSLETGETACLGLIDGDSVHYVAEVIPAIADEESWLGRRVDLHAASMGKAFLAYVEPGRVREIVGDEPPRYTDATITNLEQFLAELDQVRAQGYAVCKGEMIIGSWGVAAPIFGVPRRARRRPLPLGPGPPRRPRPVRRARPARPPGGAGPQPRVATVRRQLAQVGRSGKPAAPVGVGLDREHLVQLDLVALEAVAASRPCRGPTPARCPRRPRRRTRPSSSTRLRAPAASASARSARAGSPRGAPRARRPGSR